VSSWILIPICLLKLLIFAFVVRMAAPGVQEQVVYTPPAEIVSYLSSISRDVDFM